MEIASNLLSCAINNAALYTFTAFYSLRLKIPPQNPRNCDVATTLHGNKFKVKYSAGSPLACGDDVEDTGLGLAAHAVTGRAQHAAVVHFCPGDVGQNASRPIYSAKCK